MNPAMKQRLYRILHYTTLTLLLVVFMMPFYISVVYSFKTKSEIAFSGLALPTALHFENYTKAIEISGFFGAAMNSLILTICVILVVVVTCSMAAYVIARGKGRFYSAMFFISLGAILIPFQVVMLPLYISLKNFSMMNTRLGLILAVSGFQVGYNIFIYTGFIKTVPVSIEEAARIDGCNRLKSFWLVVFPLLKPIVSTSIILNALTAWNEFPISLIVAQKDHVRTLPLTQFYFFGQYSVELNLAFAAFTLSMIPIIILYVVLQKYIVGGLMAGSVKG